MKNGPIEEAVQEFRKKTLLVYRADPGRLVRDARSAERAAKDHVGRWLFELLQNSDDAKASEVLMLIRSNTLYVADNGEGLKPEAVSAICGTDFSDKAVGTIGRKGVGFKSVYEVTRHPQLITVNGEGIEFNPNRAKAWLQKHKLEDGYVPYQWIPFYLTWDEVQRQDPQISIFKTYKTVVRFCDIAPGEKHRVQQLLEEWPPHSLFAFRYLRRIKAPGLEVDLRDRNSFWSLDDSRGQIPYKWCVKKLTEHPSDHLLEGIGADERRAISEDGVSIIIAAPFENDYLMPTTEYLPVHVFYPTEQKGPVRLLLHAEFLVKSDRTALIPVNKNLFNDWIAERLAYHVCEFVNASYRIETPSSHATLLVPFEERASHPVAHNLWQRIVKTAKTDLRLADIEAKQRLVVGEARLISVSVRIDLARTILESTVYRKNLLHSSFDIDKEARKALKELGCKEIRDEDMMVAIANNADLLAANTQWVWACWEWISVWAAKEPYGEEYKSRIERAKALPLVPIKGRLVKISDLEGRIVTWKSDGDYENLPDWLPLIFVEDWFRERIRTLTKQDHPIKKLCKELGIEQPNANVIQRAVGRAIKHYWKDNQGDPERFLRFILEQDWHETSNAFPALRRCPVLLSKPKDEKIWAEAGKAYFGSEWENYLIAELYAEIEGVAWVARENIGGAELRRVLEWLGVTDYPRIVKELGGISLPELPKSSDEWKKYLETARDHDNRRVAKIECVTSMEHLAFTNLDQRRATLLIRLIAKHWVAYYKEHAEVVAEGTHPREQKNRSWQVKAKWWWEVCEKLPLPRKGGERDHISFISLWIPEKRTNRAIGDLLPVIDLDSFGNDKDLVCDWLINEINVRTRIEQLKPKESEDLIANRIPDKAPIERVASDDRLRDRVTGWYVACLETIAEQECVSQNVLASCPLLCRKGGDWQYVADEPRYLNDDNDLAPAFAEDVWLFHIPLRLAADAVNYLNVMRLSESVQVHVTHGELSWPLNDTLMESLKNSLPYIWAWRSSQRKKDAERLSTRLKNLVIYNVPILKANLSLHNLFREVEWRWHATDDIIFLHKDYSNEAELALAFSKALDARSEADFYENLLRCEDDHQRKEKLLSKGIAEAEIERCLREYSKRPNEKDRDRGEKSSATSQEPSPAGCSHPPSNGKGKIQKGKQQPIVQQGGDPGKQSTSADTPKETLRLKNAKTANYVLGSAPEQGWDCRDGGYGSKGGAGEGLKDHQLTERQKKEVENAGREFATQELEKKGYVVEKMPFDNPGFDLRAKRSDKELRVEVKAHSGRATVVDVTQREYKEYLEKRGYYWELWNVEHLIKDDANPVVITRYNQIPDNALETRTFRVDLKKCK